MHVALAVDALFGRCPHVKQQRLEVDALAGVQQRHQRVVALALDVHLHHGQQPSDGRLVDDAVVELLGDGIAEHTDAFHQPFVVTAGVQLHDEVAALCPEVGGVRTGLHQQSDVARTVDVARVADGQVVKQSAHHVVQFHVAVQVDVSAESDGQRVLRQPHVVEVHLADVCRQRTVYLLFLHQRVYGHQSPHQLVVAGHVGMCPPVLHVGMCRQVVQVPVAVSQVVYLCVSLQCGA